MNRRKLLGFLGGAAAAGPKLAQDLAANVGAGVPNLMMPQSISDTSISGNSNWRVSRIARLKDIIAGNSEETKRDRMTRRLYEAEAFERYRLDGLRSVSAVHKYEMLTSAANERRERIQRVHAEFELADLLSGNFG